MLFRSLPFPVGLNGFGCFLPRAVFVSVVENQMLSTVRHDLIRTLIQNQIVGPDEQPLRTFHPHVTIAFRDLIRCHFKSLWDEVEHKSFADQFTADGITLLQHRSEEHTSELQSRTNLVCRLLLEKKKNKKYFVCSDSQ